MQNLQTIAALSMLITFSAYAGGKQDVKVILKDVKEDSKVCDKNSDYFKKTGQECAIKKVRFETQNYSIQDAEDPSPYYGTLGYFGFEAKSWGDVTKFGFVQSLRGCTYETKKNADGSISKRIGESIMHLNKKRILVFPDWSIDATTKDPLYYGPSEEDSHLSGGRLALYRWTPRLGVIDTNKTKDLYEILNLKEQKRLKLSPSVFVTDTPSMAYTKDADAQEYQNISMEFDICLYNLKDIPLLIENDNAMTGIPIACYKWNSQFAYNYDKQKFENLPSKGLDPFCASQIPENPADIFKREQETK